MAQRPSPSGARPRAARKRAEPWCAPRRPSPRLDGRHDPRRARQHRERRGGRPGSPPQWGAAFSKLRLVALAERATHAMCAAVMAPCGTGENTLAREPSGSCTADTLVLADRDLGGSDKLFSASANSGSEACWRTQDDAVLPSARAVRRRLVRLRALEATDRRDRAQVIAVWAIEYQVANPRRPGAAETTAAFVTAVVDGPRPEPPSWLPAMSSEGRSRARSTSRRPLAWRGCPARLEHARRCAPGGVGLPMRSRRGPLPHGEWRRRRRHGPRPDQLQPARSPTQHAGRSRHEQRGSPPPRCCPRLRRSDDSPWPTKAPGDGARGEREDAGRRPRACRGPLLTPCRLSMPLWSSVCHPDLWVSVRGLRQIRRRRWAGSVEATVRVARHRASGPNRSGRSMRA